MTLLYIILATSTISLLSLVGVLVLTIKKHALDNMLVALVGLSTGTLLGGAFFHLLPEASENLDVDTMYLLVVLSFMLFFMVERVFHWRHCHEGVCEEHAFGYLNLVGDAIHNFIDGIIIAGAFIVSIPLGITTSLALAFHEIPQEISDFGVLLYSGISRKKALFYNFLVAATAVIGGIVGYLMSENAQNLVNYMLPIAAGGFIYIATSDLIPELRKETDKKRSTTAVLLFIAGLILMYSLKFFE